MNQHTHTTRIHTLSLCHYSHRRQNEQKSGHSQPERSIIWDDASIRLAEAEFPLILTCVHQLLYTQRREYQFLVERLLIWCFDQMQCYLIGHNKRTISIWDVSLPKIWMFYFLWVQSIHIHCFIYFCLQEILNFQIRNLNTALPTGMNHDYLYPLQYTVRANMCVCVLCVFSSCANTNRYENIEEKLANIHELRCAVNIPYY